MQRKKLHTIEDDEISILEEINVNEWCIFKSQVNDSIILGLVLNFKYLCGSTIKQRQYSREYAPIKYTGNEDNKRGISVIGTFYVAQKNGHLDLYYDEPELEIENYVCTIRRPMFSQNSMVLSERQMAKINNICKLIQYSNYVSLKN